MRILRAIIDGKHDPKELAELREPSCQSSEEDFVKALTGNDGHEHLFALRQAVELFDTDQKKIEECDKERATALAAFDKKGHAAKLPEKPAQSPRKNQPHFDARTLLDEMAGIELTAIDGLEASTTLTIVSETGLDMSSWLRGKDFSGWLALRSNNRVTGGKPIRNKAFIIRPNRAAQAFRLAAQTPERSQSALGAFFRRIQSRTGRAGAIKATAHKLALIFYSMLKNKTEYRHPGVNYDEQRYRERLLNSLKRKAATLEFALSPIQQVH